MSSDDKKFLGIVLLVLLVLAGVGFILFYPIKEARMVVRSMAWERGIHELEDYWVHECTTTTTDSDGKIKTTCQNVKRTKRHNTWVTGGQYPVEPFWETNYTIRPGHYERRWESYTVLFSDDRDLFPYACGDLADYERFKPRQAWPLKVNLLGQVIEVMEVK